MKRITVGSVHSSCVGWRRRKAPTLISKSSRATAVQRARSLPLYITADGQLAIPNIQLFILTNDSETWLSDLRMPMGIHRIDHITSDVLAEVIESTCMSFINESLGNDASGFVVLDSRGEVSRGFQITDVISAVRREGEEVVVEKTLFPTSESTRLPALVKAFIAK